MTKTKLVPAWKKDLMIILDKYHFCNDCHLKRYCRGISEVEEFIKKEIEKGEVMGKLELLRSLIENSKGYDDTHLRIIDAELKKLKNDK